MRRLRIQRLRVQRLLVQRLQLRRCAHVVPRPRPQRAGQPAGGGAVKQQRPQRGMLAGAHRLNQCRPHQGQIGVGQRPVLAGGRAHHPAGLQRKVTGLVEVGVGHQPQVSIVQAIGKRLRLAGLKAKARRDDVARQQPETALHGRAGTVKQQRQRVFDAAGGLQRAAVVAPFQAVADRQAPAAAVAQRGRDLVFQPGAVDHHLAHTGSGQRQQVPLDHRPAGHRQQRLGGVVGQWAHACAPAGGQDQGGEVVGLRWHGRRSLGRCRLTKPDHAWPGRAKPRR